MLKTSVIIPVFNVEQYLSKCLESAINQTFEDIEIICINDCSTDGSLSILQDYASKDKRIKLINLPQNKGVSFARNTGIDKAKGDYITFLDPDDWYELNLIETVYDKISNEHADLLQFGHNCYANERIVQDNIINKIKEANNKNYLKYFNDFANNIWDKIYKTEFIKNNNINFPLNIHHGEDIVFLTNCFSKNPNIIFLAKSLYNYNKNREGSALQQYDKIVLNIIDAAYYILNTDFYINANSEYKILCIKKIINCITYFCFYSITKKCSIKTYSLQLKEFITYMRTQVQQELIKNIQELNILEKLIFRFNYIRTNK